jgi:hypothetical protein
MTTILSTSTRQNSFEQEQLPNKEIEEIFNLHHSLSTAELLNIFSIIINKISQYIESIHLAVFTLEQNVKQDDYHLRDLDPIEDAIFRMEPVVHVLGDLSDIVFSSGDDEQAEQNQVYYQLKITKIQSEWSSLQHFSSSVKKQLITKNEEKELIQSVERLLIQMDHVSLIMFDFQEKKHIQQTTSSSAAFVMSSSSCSESTITTTTSSSVMMPPTPVMNDNNSVSKDDQAILEIDNAFEPLLSIIENIYQRIQQQQQSTDTSSLHKRFQKVKEKWEILQYERDELKFEHKEDKWLSVFRRVADQVDIMIDGLDRSVVQCYSLVQQIKDWQQQQQQRATTASTSTFDKFQKSLLRSFHHSSSSNTANQGPPPVDKEKFKSVEKSFEAKYKYYTPSIDRMLSMLGNGISARASRDNTTSQRHESMISRWNHLKDVMDELRSRDLIETEKIISFYSSTSSNSSSHWKGIRYKTPEPSQQDRSVTPNRSQRINYSPLLPQHDYYHQSSLLRGSVSDSSSVGSSPKSNKSSKATPRPTRNGNITTSSKNEDFYDEDERYYGVDLMKLNNTTPKRPPSSTKHYIRSNSTLETTRRNRSSSVEKPIIRSKTPTIRSKSSMGDIHNRSMTPSLIPRPKTPSKQQQQDDYLLQQRPRSQLQSRNKQSLVPPPVPPIPKYVMSHENDYAAYRNPARKQQITEVEDNIYHADPKDPLDIEVGQIVNASPISIKCVKGPQPGRYYFGNELSMSSMGGKKMYTCKLMTYNDRRGGQFKNNKVLVRVGGGWQDLEFFLLEHSSLMASDVVVVRSFASGGNNAATRRL